MKHGITAITNLEYSGRQMYSTVDEKTYITSFYIPYKLAFLGDSIMLLKIEIKELKKRLNELYTLIMIVILFIALFHMAFAVIINRLFIRPIQLLHGKSLEISSGNLEARAKVKRKDEIGELGMAFNSMADSIQEKILTLQEHNEKMDHELKMAGGVQKLIFPELTNNDFYNIGVYHKPFTEVSGDYYDVIELDDSKKGFLLVDVSGHGMPAALVTMIVKEIFERDARKYSQPSELLKFMNTTLINVLYKNEMFSGIYFTAVYMILDKNNVLHFCNAGHQQVIVIQQEKKQIARLNSCGTPIGISEDMNEMYRTGKIKLTKGDKICMFTDGISEPKNGDEDEFGTQRIIDSIKKDLNNSVESMVDDVVATLMEYIDNKKLDDDATLIMVEIK
jgi:sigma-B regulation protein RsbU (phosphoserine phosphatase)